MGITKRKNIKDVPYDLFNKNTAERNLTKLEVEEDNLKATIHDERINSEIEDLAEIIEITQTGRNITERKDGSLSYRKGGKTKTVSDLQKSYLMDTYYDPTYAVGDIVEGDDKSGIFSNIKSSIKGTTDQYKSSLDSYITEGKDIYSTSFGGEKNISVDEQGNPIINEEEQIIEGEEKEEVEDAEVGTGGGKNIGDWLEKGVKWVDDKIFGDTKIGNVIEEGVGATGNIVQGVVTLDPTALVAGAEDVVGMGADITALATKDGENTDLENWLRTGESGVHTVSDFMQGDIKGGIESGVGTAQQFSKAAGNEELARTIDQGYGMYENISSLIPSTDPTDDVLDDETTDLFSMAKRGGNVYDNGDVVADPWRSALESKFAGDVPSTLLDFDWQSQIKPKPDGTYPSELIDELASAAYRNPNKPHLIRLSSTPAEYTGYELQTSNSQAKRVRKELRKKFPNLSRTQARKFQKFLYESGLTPDTITSKSEGENEKETAASYSNYVDDDLYNTFISSGLIRGKNLKKGKKGKKGGNDKSSLFEEIKKGTKGDKIGLTGVLAGNLANLAIAKASRDADLPMKNVYEGVMDEAVNMRKRDIGRLEGLKGQAAADVRTRFGRTPDTAMSYQQRRVRELQRERAIDKAVRQSNLGYDQTIEGQKSQLAQMIGQGSQLERAGEAQARQIEQANRDAYFSALSESAAGISTGLQKVGQDMNLNRLNQTALQALQTGNFKVVVGPDGEQLIYDPATGTYTPLVKKTNNNNNKEVVSEEEAAAVVPTNVAENEVQQTEENIIEAQDIGSFGALTDIPEEYAHNVATIANKTYYKRGGDWVEIGDVTDVTDEEWNNMTVFEQGAIPEVRKKGGRIRKRKRRMNLKW